MKLFGYVIACLFNYGVFNVVVARECPKIELAMCHQRYHVFTPDKNEANHKR